MNENLPVCVLCGWKPGYSGRLVGCAKPFCGVRDALMEPDDWRRLMARPSLAPEHVEELRELLRECETYDRLIGVVNKDSAAIRAALAALGEE